MSSGLQQTSDEHYIQHDNAISAIIQDLDGYLALDNGLLKFGGDSDAALRSNGVVLEVRNGLNNQYFYMGAYAFNSQGGGINFTGKGTLNTPNSGQIRFIDQNGRNGFVLDGNTSGTLTVLNRDYDYGALACHSLDAYGDVRVSNQIIVDPSVWPTPNITMSNDTTTGIMFRNPGYIEFVSGGVRSGYCMGYNMYAEGSLLTAGDVRVGGNAGNKLYWYNKLKLLALDDGKLQILNNDEGAGVVLDVSGNSLQIRNRIDTGWGTIFCKQVQAYDLIQAGTTYFIGWNGRGRMRSPDLGTITLTNYTEDSFDLLQFGGTSDEFPAIKRVGRDIHLRTADDGWFTSLACATLDAYGDTHIDGNLGIGTGVPTKPLNIVGSDVCAQFESYSEAGNSGAGITLLRARGTKDSPANLVSNTEVLGFIRSLGKSNVYDSGGLIEFRVDDTLTTNDVPTAIIFYTGSRQTTKQEVMRLSSAGQMLVQQGTVGAPSIAQASETNTGFYFGTNWMGFSVAGVGRLSLTNSGVATWAGGGYNAGQPSMRFYWNNGTSIARYNTAGIIIQNNSGDQGIALDTTTDGKLIITDEAGNPATLDVNGGIILGNPDNQRYSIVNDNDRIIFQGQSSGTAGSMWFFSKDGDATDNLAIGLFGKGSPEDISTYEDLVIGWLSSRGNYEIYTAAAGVGSTLQSLDIYTGTNMGQVFLKSDGNVGIGTQDPAEQLTVGGNAKINGSLDVDGYTYLDGGLGVIGQTALSGTLTVGNQIFAIDGSEYYPGFAFDSAAGIGIYKTGSSLAFANNSIQQFRLTSTGQFIGSYSGSAGLLNTTSSSAVPTINPYRNKTHSGLGGDSSGRVFITVNAIEGLRVEESSGDITVSTDGYFEARSGLGVVGNSGISGDLDVEEGLSVSGSFLPPRITTATRDALTPVEGMVIFNTTTKKHQGYNGTTWNDFY